MPKSTCSVEGCKRQATGRGWCNTHYQRWYRNGDPLAPLKTIRRPDGMTWTDYFWFRISVKTPDECWDWKASRNTDGYGNLFTQDGRIDRAHRVSYEMTHGAIPDGVVIRHTCDRPICCNPAHLIPGTQADNIADMWGRGRGVSPSITQVGEQHHLAVLTEATVREARAKRAAGSSVAQIATQMEINRRTLSDAIAQRTWRHVE